MATVMGISRVGSGVGEKSSSSRKTVRLSVDSGTSENLAENEAALPSLTAAKERVVSVSEIDPGLLLAATIFVQVRNTELKWWRRPLSIHIFLRSVPQELTESAKIEADRRLHPPSETQVRGTPFREFSPILMNVVREKHHPLTRRRCASCEVGRNVLCF